MTLSRWDRPTKTVYINGEKSSNLSEISSTLRWDLTWVGWINSHKRFAFTKRNKAFKISLRWDVSPRWDDFSHIKSSWLNFSFFQFTFSSCYITTLSKRWKKRYSKEKKEKNVQAAKGCCSLTDIFERLVPPHFTIIILITQVICGTWFHKQ